MAKDITLKNGDGSMIYYPKTVSALVYDNESGETVKEQIDESLNNGYYWNGTTAALMATVLSKLAFVDTTAQDEAEQLISIFTSNPISHITATYIGGTKYIGDSVSVNDFRVTAHYLNNTTAIVTASSITPTLLTSTSNTIKVNYGSKSVNVSVPAQFNQPVSLTNISTTQVAAEGDTVNLAAITYTIVYQNGNSVVMEDPNIITASPTTLVVGSNTITIALVDYPSVTGTLIINAGGAVTSAVVTLDVASDKKALDLTFDEPMTVMPTNIAITSTANSGATVSSTTVRSATITYNSSTETWGGKVTISSGEKNMSNVTVVVNESNGKYTGVSISNITYLVSGTSYDAKFSKSRSPYTFTFTS